MTRRNRSRTPFDDVDVERVLGLGIFLQARVFDRKIVRYGNSGEYRKHVRCPCVRDGSRTGRIDCAHCFGTGRLWPERLRIRTNALDTGRQATLQQITAGTWAEGTIQITFPSAIEPAMGDQWLPDGEEMTVEETFQRDGAAQVDGNEIRDWITLDAVELPQVHGVTRLTYERPCCFEAVLYTDPDTGALREAQPYQYAIDGNRVWTWRAGGPRPGDSFVVRYRAPTVYQIHTAVPRYRAQANERMPYVCTAVRVDKLSTGVDGDIRQ